MILKHFLRVSLTVKWRVYCWMCLLPTTFPTNNLTTQMLWNRSEFLSFLSQSESTWSTCWRKATSGYTTASKQKVTSSLNWKFTRLYWNISEVQHPKYVSVLVDMTWRIAFSSILTPLPPPYNRVWWVFVRYPSFPSPGSAVTITYSSSGRWE